MLPFVILGDTMHKAGNELIESGFEHVVEIRNRHKEKDNFLLDVDFELYSENSWMDRLLHWRGCECKVTPIDGELPGMGIYVFFKSVVGATLCRQEFH